MFETGIWQTDSEGLQALDVYVTFEGLLFTFPCRRFLYPLPLSLPPLFHERFLLVWVKRSQALVPSTLVMMTGYAFKILEYCFILEPFE